MNPTTGIRPMTTPTVTSVIRLLKRRRSQKIHEDHLLSMTSRNSSLKRRKVWIQLAQQTKVVLVRHRHLLLLRQTKRNRVPQPVEGKINLNVSFVSIALVLNRKSRTTWPTRTLARDPMNVRNVQRHFYLEKIFATTTKSIYLPNSNAISVQRCSLTNIIEISTRTLTPERNPSSVNTVTKG